MAKYTKQYTANRKIKTGKKILDGLTQMGPDGNPIIKQDTNNPYNQAPQLTKNSLDEINTSQKSAATNQAVDQTVATTASALSQQSGNIGQVGKGMGWLGYATAAEGMGKSFIPRDQYGNPKSDVGSAANELITPDHEQMIGDLQQGHYGTALADSTGLGKFGRAASELTGNSQKQDGFWGFINDKLHTRQDPKTAPVVTPYVDTKDHSQDAAWQKLNNQTQMALGGPMQNGLTRYDGGFKHADGDNENTEGGIPIGGDSVVEKGETRGLPDTDSKDYIFSDTLKVPGKKYTFAMASKRIENKYSKRDNDSMSKEAMQKEISEHMGKQEELRDKLMNNAYKKAFGGPIGSLTTGTDPINSYPMYQQYNGKYYKGNGDMTANAFSTASRQYSSGMIPNANEISADEYNKNLGTGNMMPTYNSPKGNVPISSQSDYRMTGGTNGVPAYYFKGNTPVNESEYIKQTQAKPFRYGGKMKFVDGSYLPPMDVPEDPTLKPFQSYPSPQNTNNNFDPSTLYNAGNFLGGAYDIYRGAKGGDSVNYDRVNPETINPELVNYQPSRDLNRRDIKEGFRNTQSDLRNVDNPAQYLNLITQTAAQRDKTISDSNAKSYENELNMNSQIKSGADQFNAQAKNQGKYFNAQTQQAEANARQQEKDIASNTLQAGLSSFGEAMAGTGRDRQYNISQAESKKFIGSSDFSPVSDKSGKITGYKHKTSGKIYNIVG